MSIRNPKMVSQMLGVGVFAMGGLALLGWALNIALLKSLVFDSPAISPLTALCLLFFGFSLWSFARDTDVGVRWQAPQFCAFAVGLIGLFKLADYLLGWNVNFDGLGFGGQLAQRMPSKNMSFVSALNCFLLGGALLFAGSRRNFVAFQTLILFAGSISWLGCLHYFYGGKPLAPLEATSFLSSIAFVLLAIGLFCTRTDRGLMALFLSDSAGGLLVRRLLLPALAIPFIIGWLGQKMQEAGWFGPEAGIALFGLSNAVLFAALIWRNAALLHHADSERRSTAAQLDDSYKEIKDLKSALDEHAIVAITNPQGKITYVNDKFCAISKYSRAELMGQDHRLINSGYHPKEFIRDLWMTIAAGRVWQGEIKNRAQDGSFYWVATTIVPQVGHDGKPRQYVAIREDITQRKNAEEALARLAAIVNSSDDAIIGKTLNGVITSWNAAAEKMLGYSSREAIGQPLTIIFPPERVPEEIDFLARIARGESIKNYETIRVRKDGRRLDVSVTISPIEDASGKIVGASKIMHDITERKRAQEQLRNNEHLLRLFIEHAPAAIAMFDREMNYLIASRRYFKDYDIEEQNVVGRSHYEVFPNLPQRWIEVYRRCLQGAIESSEEDPFIGPDGRTEWVHWEIRPWNQPTGEIGGVVLFSEVVTERKQAKMRLEESERRFQTLANSISQLAWVARADGFIIWYNRRWYDYTGTTPKQMEGWGWQGVHDPRVLPQVMDQWTASIAGGQPFEMEFPLRGADGQFRRFLTRALPFKDAEGKVVQWFGTNTDVDELKRAEEQIRQLNAGLEQRVVERTAQLAAANEELDRNRAELQNLFESLPGLYLVLTPDLTIVAASNAYLKATMTTREGILGRKLFEVFPDNPADLNANGISNLRASLDQVLLRATSHTMAIQKYDIRRPDGVFEERYWSPINAPVLGMDRQVKYIIHRVEDVTEFVQQKQSPSATTVELQTRMEQMQAEIYQSAQKLQAANRQLETANLELESFSYSVSHDLRAPLRAVNGFAGIVLEDYGPQLPEQGRQYLERIRKGGARMGELIDDLLEFSRLSRQSLRPGTVDHLRQVQTTLEELKTQHEGRQIQFQIGGLPPCPGDSALIRQVWANLLSNAIKYSRQRHPAIIEIGCHRENGENVYFVRDNGTGFDMQYAHKLFGVFQRLHRADEFEGTGVGLAIVQRIVHRHGGRVWADAKENEGATFRFTLGGEDNYE